MTSQKTVSDGRSDLPAAGLPLSLLAELKDQIPCDELDFDGHDAARQIYGFSQAVPRDDGSGFDSQLYWKLYWDSVCSYPDRTGDVRSVTKPSDFYSVRQWHSTAVYTELFRPVGLEHDLLLCLVAVGHTNRQLARRLGISEGTVRTHLENIYARLQVSSRAAAVTRALPHQAIK